jgi:hypothetical protein
MSGPWTEFCKRRYLSYEAAIDRNAKVYGKQCAEGALDFYRYMCQLFNSGKLGGVRVYAEKPE